MNPAGPPPVQRRMLAVAELATYLGVSGMTVYRLIDTGQMRAYRIGRCFRVDSRDLAAFLRAAEIETS